MPTGWNDTFLDTDFTDVDVLNMFEVALWEREQAKTDPTFFGGPPTEHKVGHDVQRASLYAGWQQRVENFFGQGWFWYRGFYKPDFDPEGKACGNVFLWDYLDHAPFWGQQIGDADPNEFSEWADYTEDPAQGILDGFAAAGLQAGWMRKRPREINNVNAVEDVQGNLAAVGQRAKLLGSTTGSALSSYVVEWNGSQWQGDPDTFQQGWDATTAPDILYTDRAKFRTIFSGSTAASTPYDRDGNPAEIGHRALIYSTGSVYGPRPGVYEYDGTTWVLDPSANPEPPDTLVGEAGAERTIDTTAQSDYDNQGHVITVGMRARCLADGQVYYRYDLPELAWYPPDSEWNADNPNPDQIPVTGSGVLFGKCQPGDYIGAWLLSDVRDMLNALGNRTDAPITNTGYNDGGWGYSSGGPHATGTSAGASAVANFVCEATYSPWSLDSAIITAVACSSGSPCTSYSATIDKHQYGYTCSTMGHRSRTIKFVAGFYTYNPGGGWAGQYHAQGQTKAPASGNIFHVWETVELGAGATDTAEQIIITDPCDVSGATFAAAATYGTGEYRGFFTQMHRAVVEWDFLYGPRA